ncbi:putative histone acetyltransferase [Dactylonectria estremocensis]|uniref:Histone acetyltransferase n=1 Tax=Dactylonectria estremocensis TaxID=1079267 RepID=A0A9P9DK40_9HYPO|nr:putative histone acetyltransferase [Dactylonectria estremocensis]
MELHHWVPSLARLLQSCVNVDPASSSIGFRAPLSEAKATAYWESLSANLFGTRPSTTLFILSRGSNAVGTIQLVTHPKETHAHKIEVGKLLVAGEERGHGLGRRLMEIAERYAFNKLGKTMVLLDTATETPARGFYLKLGYTEWGICPQYAESATGDLHDCSFFYKILDK